jgi:histidinol-phosphate/aromatic aminotransferase/cobyric acid decarboxylase-like protein/adenosyl cobinamide kinase/adenosyl cobinamide phosphate guanylyltransferase
MGTLVLIVGGQKSGKSTYASRRAAAAAAGNGGRTVAVVTPAVVRDEEFAARVARHRADRPAGWHTLERFDLDGALRDVDRTHGPATPVIVDALDTWLAETLLELGMDLDDDAPGDAQRDLAERDLATRIDAFAAACAHRPGPVLLVAGQPGLGPHAVGAGARTYVDLHGQCLQRLSTAADEAVLMIAGRPLPLGSAVPEPDPPGPPDQPGAPGGGRATPARGYPATADLDTDALRLHGDTMVPDGCVDLAVNVEPGPPAWLRHELVDLARDLTGYPDDGAARRAAADRHGRLADECLVVAGAAEAFWLLAQVLDVRHAVSITPGFTEPEAALRHHGVPTTRVARDPTTGWRFDPDQAGDADLVVLGRPNNPTGTVDDLDVVESLCRPGRVVVVDEAFAEFLDDADGLAPRRDLPGLVSIRSLTKLWGIAGLRVGYLLAPADIVAALARARQPWPVPTPALHALERLVTVGEPERRTIAAAVRDRRDRLATGLAALPDVEVVDGHANFLLVQTPGRAVHEPLLDRGFAVRPCHTFAGLDHEWLRITVRDDTTNDRFVEALRDALEDDG